jgi:hypothetical protein
MENKYLEKVASRLGRGIGKAWGETSGPSKLSLGLGTASVGLGAANYNAARDRNKKQESQVDVERKSLNALRGIHKALVNNY